MLCSASLSSSRSAGFQPAWRPRWSPSQEGHYPQPLFGRLVQAPGPPDGRGLGNRPRLVDRATVTQAGELHFKMVISDCTRRTVW